MAPPLHAAAERGDLEVVKSLIVSEGANVNAADEGLNTPMHLAAYRGHPVRERGGGEGLIRFSFFL